MRKPMQKRVSFAEEDMDDTLLKERYAECKKHLNLY